MTYKQNEENTDCQEIRRVLIPKTNPCLQETGSHTSFCPCKVFTPTTIRSLLCQQLVPP